MATDLDISRCCVCYFTYNRTDRAPMSMPCGHTFCHGCIRHMTNEILFSCGICRTISPVGWAPTKKNVILIQALEKMNLLATDDTKEELDSSPLGETVDERQLHNVASKDMLSYGKKSLQVLACHMKSRYNEFDEAMFAVNRTIVKIDGRLLENEVSGEPAPRYDPDDVGPRLFEDAEVENKAAPDFTETLRNSDHVEFSLNDYFRDNVVRIANRERVINAFTARREHDMEVNRVRRRPVIQAAAVRRDEDNASDAGEGANDADVIDLTNDDDDAPRADASDDTDDNAGGNSTNDRVNAPTETAPTTQPNGFFIPPPFIHGPYTYENFVAMYGQPTNYPTFAVNGLVVNAPAPPLHPFNAGYYCPYIGIAVPPLHYPY